MANIHEYLRWRGDVTFDERPFNDADNLVLSAFVYLDFTGIIPTEEQGGSIPLCVACRALLLKSGGDVGPFVRSLAKVDTSFVRLIGNSRRFGNAQLSAYADKVSQDRTMQFAAMQISLPHVGTYIAYRGTDTTIVGWRENLMLSFTITSAQEEAVRYLVRFLALEHDAQTQGLGATVFVGGHSKGGNLAEYAAAFCPEHLRGRITRVYSNDGPGMAPEVVSKTPREILGDRLHIIVPSYSVIGMIFARKNERRSYVASPAMRIEQHDITTWQVVYSGIEEVQELQPECIPINDTIASWARDTPLADRERITNDVFDALQAGGAKTFEDIVSSPDQVQQVLRALNSLDERTRELVLDLVQRTIDSSVGAVKQATKKAYEEARNRFRDKKALRASTVQTNRPL